MVLDQYSYDLFTEEEWVDFFENRTSVSDREAVIEHVSLYEMILKLLITYHMEPQERKEAEPRFRNKGEFAEFAARIKECKRLKIIDRDTRRNLEILKDLRNAGAHSPRRYSFEMPALKELCGQFKLKEQLADGRARFNEVTYQLLAGLIVQWTELYQKVTGRAPEAVRVAPGAMALTRSEVMKWAHDPHSSHLDAAVRRALEQTYGKKLNHPGIKKQTSDVATVMAGLASVLVKTAEPIPRQPHKVVAPAAAKPFIPPPAVTAKKVAVNESAKVMTHGTVQKPAGHRATSAKTSAPYVQVEHYKEPLSPAPEVKLHFNDHISHSLLPK